MRAPMGDAVRMTTGSSAKKWRRISFDIDQDGSDNR